MDSAGGMHVTNADQYSIAFARTPAQVLLDPEPKTLTSTTCPVDAVTLVQIM